MSRKLNLVGQRYGRLVVIEELDERNTNGRPLWLCRCDCGNEKKTTTEALRSGGTSSCGCLKMDALVSRSTKHGECSGTKGGHNRLYQIYTNMITRCYCSSSRAYASYGGRGITVCDAWRKDRETFFTWARANGYTDSLTLDRIDVNSNYSPDNCRFVDRKIQGNNTTRNHYIEYAGQRKTLSEWSDVCGVPYYTLRSRINILNWPPDKAFTTPVRKMKSKVS